MCNITAATYIHTVLICVHTVLYLCSHCTTIECVQTLQSIVLETIFFILILLLILSPFTSTLHFYLLLELLLYTLIDSLFSYSYFTLNLTVSNWTEQFPWLFWFWLLLFVPTGPIFLLGDRNCLLWRLWGGQWPDCVLWFCHRGGEERRSMDQPCRHLSVS